MRREVYRDSNEIASMGRRAVLRSVGEDTTGIRETILRGAVQLCWTVDLSCVEKGSSAAKARGIITRGPTGIRLFPRLYVLKAGKLRRCVCRVGWRRGCEMTVRGT
jgi:hypothetical protein